MTMDIGKLWRNMLERMQESSSVTRFALRVCRNSILLISWNVFGRNPNERILR